MSRLRLPVALCMGALALAGCKSKSSAQVDEPGAPAPSSSSLVAALHPVASAYEEAAVNPGHEKAYAGPIGAVKGVVRVSGDHSPDQADVLAQIPAGKCDDARAFYGKLFREGVGRELGDVLVAVTEYKGFVPATGDTTLITARGCAFPSRTIAMTFGQRLDVKNRSSETFIPLLRGAPQAALVVALPGGDPVQLFPPRPGEFLLEDQTHTFATAHVFVLKYPTFAVTGLDGVFEIKDIPAGDVLVNAYLPSTGGRASSHVNIVAGDTATLDLTIPFDASKQAKPAPSASAH
ncbi:MAG TPA: hypothetical protein VH062_18885 [Polyangiaceae bacterium]|jgi:hypothetical protein|nr:hypothetical protein [Polyangiaceae bacterium]